MADDERLIVLLEARVAEFEKRMAAAERRGSAAFTKLRRDSASATGAMEADMVRSSGRINQALASTSTRIGAVGIALRGFAAGAVVTGLTMSAGKVSELARQIAEVGNEAKRAGVSARAFQEWRHVAEQNRVPVDALIDGLKELNLRADEFVVTGKGPAAEAFQRLGYTAQDLKAKLEDPSALLLEIIGRLGEFDRAAQVRIADEVFGGTGGERFVELLDQGEAGLRRTIDEANALGVVMDDQLIQRADDLNRVFQSVAATVGSSLKAAIVNAASALFDFLRLWRDFDQQRSESLQGQLNDTIRSRAKLLDEQKALQGDDGLTDNARRLGFGADSVTTQARIADLQGRIDALTATEDEIIGVLQSRSPYKLPERPAGGEAWTPPVSPPGGFGGGGGRSGGGGGGQRANALDRETAAVLERTAALQAATAAQAAINPLLDDYGAAAERAATQQELLAAAEQAGVAVTPELMTEIDRLADAYGRAQAASRELDESQAEVVRNAEQAARLRQQVIGGFAQDLLAGRDAADALSDALGRVADRMLDMALDGLFSPGSGAAGGGGIFGALRSVLGFSAGTANTGGSRGEVRGVVHGQEAVIPLPSGGRVPVQLQGQAGAGTTVSVNYAPSIDARGADSAAIARLETMMRAQADEMQRTFRDRVMAAVGDPRFRGRG